MDKIYWKKLWDYPPEYQNALFVGAEKKFTKLVAKKNLRDVVHVFKKHEAIYWLGYGTLLGCVRDNDFIEHDIDVDICCYSYECKKIFFVIEDLKKLGFELIRAWKRWTVFSVIRDGVYVDIILFNSIGLGRYRHASWVWHPEDLVLTQKKFMGIKVNIPKNYEILLKRWYGENWKIPDKKTHAAVEIRKAQK